MSTATNRRRNRLKCLPVRQELSSLLNVVDDQHQSAGHVDECLDNTLELFAQRRVLSLKEVGRLSLQVGDPAKGRLDVNVHEFILPRNLALDWSAHDRRLRWLRARRRTPSIRRLGREAGCSPGLAAGSFNQVDFNPVGADYADDGARLLQRPQPRGPRRAPRPIGSRGCRS